MRQTRLQKIRGLVLVLALAAAAVTPAHALDFGWDAPAGCPSAALVEAEVTRIVGRPWRELAGAWSRAYGTVSADAHGAFRLRLRVVDADGASSERSVTAASSTEATEAAVAILVAGIAPAAQHTPVPASSGGSAAAVPALGSTTVAPLDAAQSGAARGHSLSF